jgi:hypothetical protein
MRDETLRRWCAECVAETAIALIPIEVAADSVVGAADIGVCFGVSSIGRSAASPSDRGTTEKSRRLLHGLGIVRTGYVGTLLWRGGELTGQVAGDHVLEIPR